MRKGEVNTTPLISDELVTFLNFYIPEKCPDIAQTEREIWMYAGKRELVRQITQARKVQKEQITDATTPSVLQFLKLGREDG